MPPGRSKIWLISVFFNYQEHVHVIVRFLIQLHVHKEAKLLVVFVLFRLCSRVNFLLDINIVTFFAPDKEPKILADSSC